MQKLNRIARDGSPGELRPEEIDVLIAALDQYERDVRELHCAPGEW